MKLKKMTAAVLSMILATAMSLTAAAAPDQAAVLSAAPEALFFPQTRQRQ